MHINILIINLHSSSNAGDDVLTKVTLDQLYASFPYAKIVLSMNDPKSYKGNEKTIGSFMTWLKPDNKWLGFAGILQGLLGLILSFWMALGYRLVGQRILGLFPRRYKPLLTAYFEADLVVSSAGNFLYSSGRLGIPFLTAFYTMGYAWLVGKPLYSMPQTIGPLRRGWEKLLTWWIVSQMELLFVREAVSEQELKKLNAWGTHCVLVPDLAFAYPRTPEQEIELLLNDYDITLSDKSPFLGITLINWEAQDSSFLHQAEYEMAVCDVIRHFVTQYRGKVILFSQVIGPSWMEDDRVPAQRVYNKLVDLHLHLKFIKEEVSPANLKAAYGLMDVFIGTRLHSNIFALSAQVPVLAVQYQYKTRGIMEQLGLGDWVIDIEEVNSDELKMLFDKLWQKRFELRLFLKMHMPNIVKDASSVGDKIERDFYRKFTENTSS